MSVHARENLGPNRNRAPGVRDDRRGRIVIDADDNQATDDGRWKSRIGSLQVDDLVLTLDHVEGVADAHTIRPTSVDEDGLTDCRQDALLRHPGHDLTFQVAGWWPDFKLHDDGHRGTDEVAAGIS